MDRLSDLFCTCVLMQFWPIDKISSLLHRIPGTVEEYHISVKQGKWFLHKSVKP